MASITAAGVRVRRLAVGGWGSRNRNAEERGVRRAVGCRGEKNKTKQKKPGRHEKMIAGRGRSEWEAGEENPGW